METKKIFTGILAFVVCCGLSSCLWGMEEGKKFFPQKFRQNKSVFLVSFEDARKFALGKEKEAKITPFNEIKKIGGFVKCVGKRIKEVEEKEKDVYFSDQDRKTFLEKKECLEETYKGLVKEHHIRCELRAMEEVSKGLISELELLENNKGCFINSKMGKKESILIANEFLTRHVFSINEKFIKMKSLFQGLSRASWVKSRKIMDEYEKCLFWLDDLAGNKRKKEFKFVDILDPSLKYPLKAEDFEKANIPFKDKKTFMEDKEASQSCEEIMSVLMEGEEVEKTSPKELKELECKDIKYFGDIFKSLDKD